MSTIFLSYARGDDEPFVRQLYDDLTKAKFDVWFDRVNMPSRGLTFHQEIREAITDRDRLLLVVGPQAVKSEYVRQEWQYAWFDAEKVVTPILRIGDYPQPIPELTLMHCEDFRNGEYQAHLKELIRILQEPAPPMGKVIGAPALPAHFLTRTDRLISLRDALRSGLDSPAPLGGTATHHHLHGIASVSRQVGLHGMGGIGKSVLANLLARDREVRKAFPDGIFWIGLGSLPNIVSLMQRVHQQLGGDGLFSSEHEGQQKLKELLAQKAVLLVIDDVWRRQDVDAFNVLGPRCRALITTRDAGLLTSIGGTHHLLQLLTDDEALRLLAVAVGVEPANLPIDAHEVLAECGRLPLAIALAGGMAKSGVSWSDIRDALREHDLEYISDEHRSEAQHQSLWRMIEVSVNALAAEEQLRLVELVVFPEDATVPEAAITTLWESTGRLNLRNARKFLTKLKQRSLIQFVEESGSSSARPGDGQFFLHDLIHDYGVARQAKSNEELKTLHSQLLSAYEAKAPHGWWSGPNDGYYFQRLRHHLLGSGRSAEALTLLMDFEWLQAKTHAGLISDLCREMFEAGQATDLRSSNGLGPWYYFVRANSPFLNEHPNFYFQQAYNEPVNSPPSREAHRRWTELTAQCKLGRKETADVPLFFLEWLNRPTKWEPPNCLFTLMMEHGHRVRSVAISADGASIVSGSGLNINVWDSQSGALRLTLTGHNDSVTCVALSGDGQKIVSGSDDKTIKLWDIQTGACDQTLAGRGGSVVCVAISTDGNMIVSGSSRWIRVWNAHSGTCIQTLKGHKTQVTCIAISASANTIVSGSYDGSIKIWDTHTGYCRQTLHGPTDDIRCVSISVAEDEVISGAGDGTISVWDVPSGDCKRTIKAHQDRVNCVMFSANGKEFVSGSDDRTIKVWTRLGRFRRVLRGHNGYVRSVSVSPSSQLIVSGSDDYTIKVWNLDSRDCRQQHKGHCDLVLGAACSDDGEKMVTASWDCTVKVWDVRTGNCLQTLHGHASCVHCVTLSADGQTIVSGSHDQSIKVWDTESGTCRQTLHGHTDDVRRVGLSIDGLTIVSFSNDGPYVKVWDVISGNCLATYDANSADARTAWKSVRLTDSPLLQTVRGLMEFPLHKAFDARLTIPSVANILVPGPIRKAYGPLAHDSVIAFTFDWDCRWLRLRRQNEATLP